MLLCVRLHGVGVVYVHYSVEATTFVSLYGLVVCLCGMC
jgi:hypothetical protein